MLKTEQINIIVGKKVELLCFAQYSVYVHLEGEITITVEGGFRHTHNATEEEYQEAAPINKSSLMTILDSSVAAASIDHGGDLQLVFSNGDRLNVHKCPEFESYRLKIRGEEFFA
jgi:hypothetical protein